MNQRQARRESRRWLTDQNTTTRSRCQQNSRACQQGPRHPQAQQPSPETRASDASAWLQSMEADGSRCGSTRGVLVPEKGARPDRTTDQGRRPNRAPPPVIRRRSCDGAFPPEQAVRLVAARRISPEATYGCGSAPESDRLPLLRWVKLCPHPTTHVAPRQSPCNPVPRQAVSRRVPVSSSHDF